MAAKIVNPSFPELNHDLRFLLTHYPAAYEVDRTAGSNPVRQELANLNEAGSLYGAIIYNKAPIAMRQLETIAGERGFRDGMREYLKKHSFGNATWLDLVSILEARNPGKVAPWSRAWIEQRGRPEITVAIAAGKVTLTQRDPLGRGLMWPQLLQVIVDGVRLDVEMSGRTAEIAVKGRPEYVLPNGGGLGYGLFKLDAASRRFLLGHIEEIGDPLTRGSAWVALQELLLEGEVKPAEFLDAAARAVGRETDEQNTQRILSSMTRTFWHELPAAQRPGRVAGLETVLRRGLAAAPTASRKSAWFNALRDVALTRESLGWIERVWRREEKIEGLTFAEPDEIDMALNLVVREVPGWEKILAAQLKRTQNPDRKARFAFVMPSLSADPAVREQAFARFRDLSNRRHEPWVLESVRYLNHPLREAHARRLVRPALELLQEIQRTGDIFFPKRWADATLGGHRSREAATAVREYLRAHPELAERLRWVVLSAADDLFRTSIRM
jgi:aminopeptidase N